MQLINCPTYYSCAVCSALGGAMTFPSLPPSVIFHSCVCNDEQERRYQRVYRTQCLRLRSSLPIGTGWYCPGHEVERTGSL